MREDTLFVYQNGTFYSVGISGNIWYNTVDSLPSKSLTDSIFTLGKVGIGLRDPLGTLHLYNDNKTDLIVQSLDSASVKIWSSWDGTSSRTASLLFGNNTSSGNIPNNSWGIFLEPTNQPLAPNFSVGFANGNWTNNSDKKVLVLDTAGNAKLTAYPEDRADANTAHLNSLYTDIDGNVKSARREITPPTGYINASTVSTGNTFNYYNHYSTQLTNIGLSPVPLVNLDFYIYSFDPAVFSNVSISSTGVLTYDIIATSTTKTFIDVRFITK